MEKFGYPDTLIASLNCWVVLLRPQQVTLGSLVLACKESAPAFSGISRDAFTELADATSLIERGLNGAFGFDKINYLMLMMVDPDVHFHVLPRYAETKIFNGREFSDFGWPGAPTLQQINETQHSDNEAIIARLKASWGDA